MSGHSKWATIKHKKGALDAKRGKIFTRLIKEITHCRQERRRRPRHQSASAHRHSRPPRPRTCPPTTSSAPSSAAPANCPARPTKSSRLRATARAALRCCSEINTDNRNRTVSEIRHVFGKNGGNMAEAGAVSWMFHKKGDIVIPKSAAKEDDLMDIVLEAGGEDLRDDGDNWEILTEPSAYEAVLEAVKKAGIKPSFVERDA